MTACERIDRTKQEPARVMAADYVHSGGRGIAAYNLATFIRGEYKKGN